MLETRIKNVKEFIEKKAQKTDPCKNICLYDEEVQDMLQNLYNALWRFSLYDSQIIYIMNEAIKGFNFKK